MSSRPGQSLPGDVVGQTCRRLGIVGMVFAFLWVLAVFMNTVVAGWFGEMAFMNWSSRLSSCSPGTRWPPHAIKALRSVARTETTVFARHLLDPAEDFAIRRRLVTVLAASRRTEAFESLFEAMRDRRFEVRYRSARALTYLAGEIPGLRIDRDRVFEVVLQEMAVERSIWETRQLIDLPDDDTSPMEAEVLRGRASRSLEHLFTLLSLVLPAETVRLAFHSLHTDDRHLRGIALEYLETVLPEAVWQRLRPFLDDGEFEAARPGRSSGQAMQELLASQESIVLALADLRRREKG